jgi:hypothetical protein
MLVVSHVEPPAHLTLITGGLFAPLCATSLFSRDDNPEDHVGHEARQATREQQDQKKKAKPERSDAEKSAQAAANAAYDAILPSQFVIVCHRLASSTRMM